MIHTTPTLPVAEGRPQDVLLTLAVHPQPAAPQSVRPVVNDVPGVMEQSGALVQLQPDHARVGEMGDMELVANVMFPTIQR